MLKCKIAPLVLVMFSSMLIAGLCAQAQDLSPENDKIKTLGPLAHKLDTRLIPGVKALRAGATNDADAVREIKRVHGRALAKTAKAEQLVVRIDAHVTDALLEQIRKTGAVINHSAPQWNTVSLHTTLSQIDKLTKIDAIRTITLQAGRFLRSSPGQQGICPNEAFTVMNVNKLPASVTGAGQTVGVISDSVDETSAVNGTASFKQTGTAPNITVTGTIPQNTGDLPPTIQVVAPALEADISSDTDEGEAMLELVHNIAPGAALAFGPADDTQPEMAGNLLLLQTAAHCTVTADDIGFYDEPFFQDGPIAQAITTNYNNGTLHFSAFGNQGNTGVLATFTPMSTITTADQAWNPPTGGAFHNWGIGGATPAFLPITLPAGDELTVVLEWNQPFQSYNLGPGSQADLDLYLFASTSIPNPCFYGGGFPAPGVLASAIGTDGTVGVPSGDPVEILNYTNNGYEPQTVYLCINHYCGVLDNMIRVIFSDTGGNNGDYMSFPSGGVNGMTSYGHPTSFNCVGVGAMFWDSASPPPNGNGNLSPEPYSSEGGGFGNSSTPGIPYYFDTSGNALSGAPVLRSAPDLMAPDGCTTSVFNTDSGFYSPSTGQFSESLTYPGPGYFPQFFGTSCATPNAAGVAALLLQAVPGTSPATIVSTLKSTANINTVPVSPNAFTGNGLVDAYAAFKLLAIPPTITSPSMVSGNVGSLFSFIITATGTQPITISVNPATLPPGLTFSGDSISGTPTTEGSFSVAVSAVNAFGIATQTLTATINPPTPVTITVQPAATPNPVSVGVLTTLSVSATGGTGQILTYSWTFGDGSTGNGGTVTHAYSATEVYTASVTISENIGALATAYLNVTVTPPPEFVSVPSATPNPAGVGQTVSFSAVATEAGNPTLSYSWNFGDSTVGSGTTPTHAYSTAGVFTATLTVADPYGGTVPGNVSVTVQAPLVGVGDDSNGLGFSNSFDIAVGVNPSDPTSSPLGGAAANSVTLQTVTVQKLQIKLNLVRTGNDTISFSGFLPIPAGFSASGKTVTLDVSGVDAGFTLNAKGSSKQMILDVSGSGYTSNATGILGSSGVFTMPIKIKKGVVAVQAAKFSVKLSKGSFAATLASYAGLTNLTQKNTPVNIVVTILFNGGLYQTTQALHYTVSAGGKTGTAK